jgi:hypothetical protein
MGSYYSIIIDSAYEYYTAATSATSATSATATDTGDSSEKQPFTTSKVFAELGKHSDVVKKLKSTTRDSINVPIDYMGEFIDDLVEFIETYIDLSKMGGKYSKMWKGYVHYEDKEKRFAEIKKYVTKILAVDTSSDKTDKTLATYLKKVITHTTGDECGGFNLVDKREGEDLDSTITYMMEHKQENMLDYINLKLNGQSGFVFCTEHDWDNCLEEGSEYILFHRFNTMVHKDNSAKALYHSPDLTISEFDVETMRTHMTGKPYFEHFDTYTEKYVVFSVKNPSAKEGELFYDEVIVIGVHCKSMGSKSDIEANMMEYKFLKSVIDSFKGLNRMVIGDFNVPEYSEGKDYFKLSTVDRITYPIQNTFNSEIEEADTFLTQGLNRWSTYTEENVAEKERIDHVGVNSQSVDGKCFVREYNTDGIYGDLNIDVTTDSRLYPNVNKVPQITGNSITTVVEEANIDWLSDHQASEAIVTDEKQNVYHLSAYNVLSKCCSGGQPFKADLKSVHINDARDEICAIISELTNIIVENISE